MKNWEMNDETIKYANDLGIDIPNTDQAKEFDNLGQYLAWHVIPHQRMLKNAIDNMVDNDGVDDVLLLGKKLNKDGERTDQSIVFLPLFNNKGTPKDLPGYIAFYTVTDGSSMRFEHWWSDSTTRALVEFRSLMLAYMDGPPKIYETGWHLKRTITYFWLWQWFHIINWFKKFKDSKIYKWFDRT